MTPHVPPFEHGTSVNFTMGDVFFPKWWVVHPHHLRSPHDSGNISPIGTESHPPLLMYGGDYNRMGMFMIGISLVSMD